ncbi:amino acid--tRNA ligase-related protein [Candidatus Carsonella ruddii]|uniref:Aspartyl-tRNA synthetase n=1 Tax=Candidatus Carsonella ruddii PC isolate NHV TaxID=1202540 RepID=J3TEP8_CARRU|nr:amino acid--tRNA ligase-related protein [Candidatus Carsonella ruddii]AFP84302.1 aspartyl-tRNA synthetase [Candidatus Carsonella ruddii PC isolate NHV]
MKNSISKNNFLINYGIIKKIKKLSNIIFIEFITFSNKIKFFIKNIKIKITNTIIGIYFLKQKEIILFEICYFKKKINKIDLKLLKLKCKIIYFIRVFFNINNYKELDIPIIEKFNNSGSKKFLIIDKNKKKFFYCLTQSPQKIKQYYMFNMINKYFQIAKCFRDEDLRSSRLKEFQQIDIENSNVTFLEFKKIIDLFLKSFVYYTIKKKILILKIKYKYIKKFLFEKKNLNLPYLYKKILIRNSYVYLFKTLFKKNKIKKKCYFELNKYCIIIVFKKQDYNLCLNLKIMYKHYNLINLKNIFLWIINFYYFKNKKIKHHYFTALKNNFKNIYNSKSLAYDIILNGIEIGGGSIRNIDFQIQNKILFKLNKKSKFINFYKRSLPQHCGIAFGLERFISLLIKININKTVTHYKYLQLIKSKKINE